MFEQVFYALTMNGSIFFKRTSSSSSSCKFAMNSQRLKLTIRVVMSTKSHQSFRWREIFRALMDCFVWHSNKRSKWSFTLSRAFKWAWVKFIICFFCRDGRIRVGDEIINVCGKRLRGLTIEEAIKALKQPRRELDIVVARETCSSMDNDDNDSYFFDEERLRDEHLRIAHKFHEQRGGFNDYQETCSEINLSSRSSKNGEHS